MRDIDSYSINYLLDGFEKYKIKYRKKKILDIISRINVNSILEIGCGTDPLFRYITNASFVVIEPSKKFVDDIISKEGCPKNVELINDFFENVDFNKKTHFDLIVCAGLLHEVSNPEKLLDKIYETSDFNSLVLLIVPNAGSLHRLVGNEMGIIDNLYSKTSNNYLFQQNKIYDMKRLCDDVDKHGFKVVDKGGFFVKPFSHDQMYKMTKARIIDDKVLDGLYSLGEKMPEIASEIFVVAKKRG